MADVYTGATSDVSTGQLTNQVLTAYQRTALFALREGVVFDQFAKVKPGNVTSPGNPVKFLFWDDMTAATTPLDEQTDVDAVGLSDALVTVTPDEYGNAVLLTIRIRTDDFLIGFDSDVANLLSYNMLDTIDTLARTAVDAATNVEYVGQATEGAVTASNKITAALVREKRAALKSASVAPWSGSSYAAVIHPDVAYDLKSETGEAAWTAPAIRNEGGARVWNDEIGTYGGFRFMESARAKLNADGGSTTVDTYTTYFFGREFLAKAQSIAPRLIMGPVTDKLRRFQPLGWHTYEGWGVLRQAAIQRLVSASSIGANS